jgi:hypothetical protein
VDAAANATRAGYVLYRALVQSTAIFLFVLAKDQRLQYSCIRVYSTDHIQGKGIQVELAVLRRSALGNPLISRHYLERDDLDLIM